MYELFNLNRNATIDKYRILILSQGLLLIFLFWELTDDPKDEEYYKDLPSDPPLRVYNLRWDVFLSRFLAFLFLHI